MPLGCRQESGQEIVKFIFLIILVGCIASPMLFLVRLSPEDGVAASALVDFQTSFNDGFATGST
ncbi:MAG: hypothetical protein ACREAZ_01430 [Nitrososphaera sp.]